MTTRKDLVEAARGKQPLDLIIKDARLVNVLTGTVQTVNIGCRGNTIALVEPAKSSPPNAKVTINAAGMWVTPGFIDGHVHNESSMCTPANWARAIIPKGTTTVCTDPHEIGNVLGKEGIRYMQEASSNLPLRYYITVPSCVPAVPELETAGAEITAQDAKEILSWERVVAIAEAMDYPGLIKQEERIKSIVNVGHQVGVPIEGHAPGLEGRGLQAYLAATGPRSSDHEASSWTTMLEKVQNGMMIYARASTYGNAAQQVAKALDKVRDNRMFGACTDDVMPNHLLDNGHMDNVVRCLINAGIDPITAIQMSTINVAEHYGFWDLGAVAPGRKADLLILDNLEEVAIRHVVLNGNWIVKDRTLRADIEKPISPRISNTVILPDKLTAESFLPTTPIKEGQVTANVISLKKLFTTLTQVSISCQGGKASIPPAEGVAFASIVPRHGQNTKPSNAFVLDLPLNRGAIASTVSHDSHNLAILGQNPKDMLLAARTLENCGGGLTATCNGKVLSTVKLPIAGLLSPKTVPEIAQEVREYQSILPELGLPPRFPTALLALALPVVPQVRLTDKGLVDVEKQQIIPLFP